MGVTARYGQESSVAVLIVVVVIVAFLLVFGLMMLGIYNGLVSGRLRVKEAWSGIDVQLKRRASLIPNIVETVKGYAAHEKTTFENVTAARAQLQQATGPAQAAEANNMLTQTLRSLFAVAENYPTLKANENFLQLQSELSDIEEKIAYARQFYNTNVLSYNTKTQQMPSAMVANMFGFQPAEFFEAEEAAREDVKVDFSSAPPATPAAAPPATPPAPGS
ncbi:MAG: LemA family protein [Chloroflexota bacterium]|nr:LemA family protein [Chloroflexota bacterium]